MGDIDIVTMKSGVGEGGAAVGGAAPRHHLEGVGGRGWSTRSVEVCRVLAIFILGVVVPVLLVIQAYRTLQAVDEMARSPISAHGLFGDLPRPIQEYRTSADYQFTAMVFLEQSNLRVMLLKQLMKSSVMNIGFAVMSIGLTCILLGFDAGGYHADAEAGSAKFKVQAVSSGIGIFLLGALLSAGGGLLPNPYEPEGMPVFKLAGVLAPGATVADAGGSEDVELLLERCDRFAATVMDGIECRKTITAQVRSAPAPSK